MTPPQGLKEPRPKVRILCTKCAYQATGQHGEAVLDAFTDHIAAVHGGKA